jgi:hypothetical protein
MDEVQKAEEPKTEQPPQAGRRPWHAPQFFAAEFVNTLNCTHGMGDGVHAVPATSS